MSKEDRIKKDFVGMALNKIMETDQELLKEKQELIAEFIDDLITLWERNHEGGYSNNTFGDVIDDFRKKWEARGK